VKIVTADEMRAIESRSERAGVSTDALMESAGLAFARSVRRRVGHLAGVRVVALIGPGNNGGDGLVAARHLARWGANAVAYLCGRRPVPDPKLDAAALAGVEVAGADDDPNMARLEDELSRAHVVIDAVLGTGRSRPIGGAFADILRRLAAAKARRPLMRLAAMDLPTGVDADSGAADPLCAGADFTVSLGFPKRGHFAFPGADFVGDLETADIGIPRGLDVDVPLDLMTREWAAARLPRHPTDSHKGTRGRALAVVGSPRFLGAAYLAALAAARIGAGLVTIAIPESLIPSVAAKAVEPTFLPLPESARGVPSGEAANVVLKESRGCDALLIGCGLGQDAAVRDMVKRVLLYERDLPPTVVDADGLNALAQTADWHERWRSDAVLTPHPGEMARLTGESRERVARERVELARESARAWNKTVVLKGAYTVSARPGGCAALSPFANPALATAGTGDVLAGAIAGLLAQGLALGDAAALGVYLHGIAGEAARARFGDAGAIASDLLSELPQAILALRGTRAEIRGGFDWRS